MQVFEGKLFQTRTSKSNLWGMERNALGVKGFEWTPDWFSMGTQKCGNGVERMELYRRCPHAE